MAELYLISPPKIDLPKFQLELDAALSSRAVSVFQLRLKDAAENDVRAAIRALLPICRKHEVLFILNDRPDIAASEKCDGVHIGQKDMAYSEARELLGPEKVIGVTCHNSKDLAFNAAEAGADYVAFGAFYPTTTKETEHKATPDLLRDWSELTTVPCVAIGGITPLNCAPLVDAGADFIAVSSWVWGHKNGPKEALSAFGTRL